MQVTPHTQKPHFFKVRGNDLSKLICVRNIHKYEVLRVTKMKALELLATGKYTYTNKAKLRSYKVRKAEYLIREEQARLRKRRIEEKLKKKNDTMKLFMKSPKGSL